MPLSKNINTYHDVVQILTTARQVGKPVYYELASPGAATMWRLRAHNYRTLLTKAARARAGNVPGFVPSTAWDDMFLTVEGSKVKIEFGGIRGKLSTEDGEKIEPVNLPVDHAASEVILRQPIPQENTTETGLDLDALEAAAARLVAAKGE
jgi:hypothetical protein